MTRTELKAWVSNEGQVPLFYSLTAGGEAMSMVKDDTVLVPAIERYPDDLDLDDDWEPEGQIHELDRLAGDDQYLFLSLWDPIPQGKEAFCFLLSDLVPTHQLYLRVLDFLYVYVDALEGLGLKANRSGGIDWAAWPWDSKEEPPDEWDVQRLLEGVSSIMTVGPPEAERLLAASRKSMRAFPSASLEQLFADQLERLQKLGEANDMPPAWAQAMIARAQELVSWGNLSEVLVKEGLPVRRATYVCNRGQWMSLDSALLLIARENPSRRRPHAAMGKHGQVLGVEYR